MNELGDIIKNNKSFFDKDEPPAGHFERFEKKLNMAKRKKSFYQKSFQYLKVASVAILVIISSLWVIERIIPVNKNKSVALGEISQEYKEVEFYYTQLYQAKLEELNKVKKIDPDLEAELMKKEFEELDSIYRTLQKEAGYNKEDERIINAMIGYYQTKVEILSQIINQLNEVRSDNTERTQSNIKKSI